jgi:hypothetical protein
MKILCGLLIMIGGIWLFVKTDRKGEAFWAGVTFLCGLLITLATPLPEGSSFTVTNGEFIPIQP